MKAKKHVFKDEIENEDDKKYVLKNEIKEEALEYHDHPQDKVLELDD